MPVQRVTHEESLEQNPTKRRATIFILFATITITDIEHFLNSW